VQCPKCGMEVTGGAETCGGCGEVMADPSSAPKDSSKQFGQTAVRKPVVYAGFWLRLVAYIIDVLLLAIVAGFFVMKPMMDRAGLPVDNIWLFMSNRSRQALAIQGAVWMIAWLYFALLESSSWQATPGKRAMGLQVTDLEGKQITFARASGRFFGKFLSQSLLFVGFVLAGFTQKKQALHDILARCLVIKKT
jgi:uncharacterized RDD family membrane protein YckC